MENEVLFIKLRTQCFSEKFLFFVFFLFWQFSFWKDLSREYLVVLKFLLEVPKFMENVFLYSLAIYPSTVGIQRVACRIANRYVLWKMGWMGFIFPVNEYVEDNFECVLFSLRYPPYDENWSMLKWIKWLLTPKL